ncbi:MAG TPA: ribbon-helix-helix domain-containing protein [Xanthobacteraceae bacterium]|jgi:predicted DNA-binding ribbon-helix-helix protein|nr:ribbon-helix-helix domain-containing protein [Xanthobacteraceae bacterium]
MKSPVVKRSIVIAGHKTSISLEDAFWKALKDIAIARHATLSDLVASIDSERQHGNLSSAIRLFVLDHYQAKCVGHVGGATADPIGSAASNPTPREMMLVPTGAAPMLRPE